MRTASFRTALTMALLFCVVAAAHAQPQSPTSIPLQLLQQNNFTTGLPNPNGNWALGINVGINGGAPRTYLFDTGSSLFNAVYTPAFWPGFTPTASSSTGNAPASTVANGSGLSYCYGGGSNGCTGYQGNIVQAPTLDFYTPPVGGQQTHAASLSASPGYQINAIYNSLTNGNPTLVAGATSPTVRGTFYGTFGASDFVNQQSVYHSGGVLGQTIVSGLTQGYVVAANGQTNPVVGTSNAPQQANGQKVLMGGSPTRQAVTPCSPCVTVGLTPQMLGQFAPVNPGTAMAPTGLVPWTAGAARNSFPNPYGGATGNNSSTEFGAQYIVNLTGAPAAAASGGILDTGTLDMTLARTLGSGNTNSGTLTVTGAAGGTAIPGLTTASIVLDTSSPITYNATVSQVNTNTIGISFFLQNSVLFDLSNQAVGYTPFFVTDANLATTAGGSLIVDGTNLPLGLAGVISGAGGVTINNGGAVQLSATNSYTGATTIAGSGALYISGPGSIAASSGVVNDGTFDISRSWNPISIQNLTGAGRVYLGAQNLLITNANGTFSGAIADTGGSYDVSGGGLALTGGTLFLSGANSYRGGTAVTGGATLGINADSGLGHASGGLTLNNGTLQAGSNITSARAVTLGSGGGTFNTNGFNVVLGTAVTGAGGLTKNGLGILTLSGANSYTGGTVVNAGTLRLAAGASLPTTGALTVNGGTLDFNGNNVTIGSLSGLGGTIALGASTLSVAETGSTSFAGTLTGTGGLTMQGPGALSLTGANTYTGPTNVTGGRLAINGSITSNVTVGVGGNLGGTGIINGTVNVLGAAAPGNSIGTLNVVGAFTQAAGSTYQVETNSAGQADRINVTGAPGTATIAGGTVTLTAASGVYAPSTTYTILNATGGVTGTYANANSLFPFLQPSLSYDANNVYLTLKPGGFAAGAATANQAAVGRVLDQSVAGANGDLATVIGTMATYTSAQGQAAMNAISGQNYSGFGTANLGGGLLFMNMLGQQMSAARGTGASKESRTALAIACDVACDAEGGGDAPSPWSLWGSAMGGTGSVAGNGNSATLTYNAGGVATGADYRFDPRFLAGFGVGFSSGNQWASGFSGQGTTNSYQASLYASFTQGAFYLDGLAGYGYNDNQMTRQIVLPNLAARTAQGRTGANQFLAQVEAGYRIGIYEPAALSITPFARFQGTTNSQNGFTESGAGALNLAVAAQTTGSARSVLGAEFAGAFGAEGREKLAVQMRLGWAHEYANTARPVTASFAGAPGANFTVFGAAPQTDSAVVSLAASTAVAQGVALFARYDGEMGTGTSSHSLNGGLRVTW